MKNIKRLVGIVALSAIMATFFVGCSLSGSQKVAYYDFVNGLAVRASKAEIPAEVVKEEVKASNEYFKALGFEVTDKKPGVIKKDTKAKDLYKRFKTKKA